MIPIVTLHLPMPFDLFDAVVAAIATRYPDASFASTASPSTVTIERPELIKIADTVPTHGAQQGSPDSAPGSPNLSVPSAKQDRDDTAVTSETV